jgi:hypothetical protein
MSAIARTRTNAAQRILLFGMGTFKFKKGDGIGGSISFQLYCRISSKTSEVNL